MLGVTTALSYRNSWVARGSFINRVRPRTWQVYGHHYWASLSPDTSMNNRTRFALM